MWGDREEDAVGSERAGSISFVSIYFSLKWRLASSARQLIIKWDPTLTVSCLSNFISPQVDSKECKIPLSLGFFLGLGIWTLPMIQGVNISSFSFFPQRLCSPVSCHVRRPVWGNVDCSIMPDSFSLFPPPFLNGIRVFFTVNTY